LAVHFRTERSQVGGTFEACQAETLRYV